MLTQLTTLLGLSPNTAPTEAKILEGGDADFAEVFARIEADIDRPKAEQNMADLIPEAEEVAEETPDDEIVELDEKSDSAKRLDERVETAGLSKTRLDNQGEDKRIGLLEKDTSGDQKPEDMPEVSHEFDSLALPKSQSNTVLNTDPEHWLTRVQMPFDRSRNAETLDKFHGLSFAGENEAPALPDSLSRSEVRIQEAHQPVTRPENRSPELQQNVPTANKVAIESELAPVAPKHEPVPNVAPDRLRRLTSSDSAPIRNDGMPIRNNRNDASSELEALAFSSTQRAPAAEKIVPARQPLTEEKAVRSDNLNANSIRANPSFSTHDFSVAAQDKIPAGMLSREAVLPEKASTSRSELLTSGNSASKNAGVDVPNAIEQKVPATQDPGVESAPQTPKPLMNFGDDVMPPTAEKQVQIVEQEKDRVLSPNQKLEPLGTITPSDSVLHLDVKQDARVKATANMTTVMTQDIPAPLELSPRTGATDPKPSDATSLLDTVAKISTGSVEKSTDMQVFVRQMQPRVEPLSNPIPSDIDSSEIPSEVRSQFITPSTQDSGNRLVAPEPDKWTKEVQKTEHWSDRSLRESQRSEQPMIVKTKPMENVIAEPLNKLAQPIPYIQANSVIYPFLAVGEEELEALEIALQATSGDLRSQQSTHVAQGSNTPPRPDPALIMRQVSDGIQKLSEAGGVELRLSPEELGSVRMQFIQGESGLTVHINAERPETLDLIRRHIDQLAKDLAESGFDSAGFSFGDENAKGQHKAGSASLDDMPEESVPTERLATQGLDGLDIRV